MIIIVTMQFTSISVDSLCLDSPGWENRSKHPFDVIIEVCKISALILAMTCISAKFCFLILTVHVLQFLSEEIQLGPIVLFLKDTEKICGNNDSYYGLKSKLEHFPAGVFIVGSHIQPDSRKEKVLFVKFGFCNLQLLLLHLLHGQLVTCS